MFKNSIDSKKESIQTNHGHLLSISDLSFYLILDKDVARVSIEGEDKSMQHFVLRVEESRVHNEKVCGKICPMLPTEGYIPIIVAFCKCQKQKSMFYIKQLGD